MKALRRSASPSSTTRPHSTARDSRVKLWSRRMSSSSSVRPRAQRSPARRQARCRTTRSKSHTFQPVSTSGSTRRTWARKRSRSARSSGTASAPATSRRAIMRTRSPPAPARAALEVALHGEGAPDAPVDQVAVREAEVGLEAVDARLAEAVAHPGHVARESHLDAHDGLATERAELARQDAHAGGEPAHLALVGGAYE